MTVGPTNWQVPNRVIVIVADVLVTANTVVTPMAVANYHEIHLRSLPGLRWRAPVRRSPAPFHSPQAENRGHLLPGNLMIMQ